MTLFKSSTSIIIVLLALSLNSVFAHTYLSSVYLNNNLLEEGDCVRPHPRTEWDFPIPLVSQADMTCGWLPAAAQPANRKCPIAAGSTIGIQWHHNSNSPSDDIVDPSHKGPVIVYLAKSDTGAGNVWFKIFEDGYANGRWGVDRMLDRRGRVDITIPSDIEPGNYLLRGEILALHGAYALNGVQPYVGCVELTISGNGNAKPAGVALPGAYKQTDPGMLISIYYGFTGYIIPGPAVYKSGSGSSNTVAPTAAPTTRPATQAPVTQAPVTQAPVTQAPVTQAPVTQAPVTQAPVTQAPVTQAPVTQAPVTQAPVTQAPVTQAPVTQAPVTQPPVTQAPVTQAPSTGSLSGFCTSKSNGDYCSPTDAGSYVSCPWEQNRPCAAGLVCQARATGGAIDCVAPRAGQNTQAPATQAPATQAPVTQPPTQAPVTQPPTQVPTSAPVTQPPTQVPTSAPATQAPGSLNGFCASKARGDYCSPTEEGSYVSCPFETNRPCAAGQVCQARAGADGVVDCVAPSSSGGPTTRPGTSPTTKPGTSAPTTPPKPIPSTMRKIIYIISNYVNGNVGDTIKAAVDSGYTHVILAFWVNHGECGRKCAAYAAADWAAYANKQAVLDYVHSKNAYLLISGGGAVDDWFSEMIPGDNTGFEIGTALANWAMENGPLDGVDLDLEGGITWPGAVQAAVDATNTVRRIIGPNRIIAHAPQAPFFHSNYLSVYDSILRLAGDTIDFIMIQFYNQDLGCYDLYDQVFLSSIITSPVTKWQCFAGTSVNEIHLRTNYPLNKIVVGKYISDGSSNWVAPEALHDWVSKAYNQLGWEAGIMLWDWRSQAPNYRTTIFG